MATPSEINGVPQFRGASHLGNGRIGLVPEPRAGDQTKFLKGDGSWATPSGGGGGGAVDSVNGQVGVVVLTKNDIGLSNVNNTTDANKPVSVHQQAALDLKANLASPALTGVPTAPTASLGTNTTQIATTEFVLANAGGGGGGAVDSVNGYTGVVVLAKGDIGLGDVDNTADVDKPVSTSQQAALDLKADLASPALSGTPTAPTATAGTNTTQIATTEFVTSAVAAEGVSFSGAHVTLSVAQSMTSGTNVDISWDTETYDIGGYWTAVSPTRLTAPSSGKYLIEGGLAIAANATGERRLTIKKAGTVMASSRTNAITSTSLLSVTAVLELAAGEYVELEGVQTSGVALNASAIPSTHFSISRLTGGVTGTSMTLARFTALDNQPPAATYATFDTRNSIGILDFDASTAESAVFVGLMPEGADFTVGIAVKLIWAASTATTGAVVWTTAFERCNTDLDSDSFATGVDSAAATTNATSGITTTTTINHSSTEIDGLTAGEMFRLKVTRKAADGADTMTGDAELIAVEVRQR